jgi:hypothetical protein
VGGSKPVVTVDDNGRIGVEKQVREEARGGGWWVVPQAFVTRMVVGLVELWAEGGGAGGLIN